MFNLQFCLHTLLFISLIEKSFNNVLLNDTKLLVHENKNKSQLTVPSEGGSIISNGPNVLIKDYHTDLLNLDKELNKGSGKSVVARKGVTYDSKEVSSIAVNDKDPSINSLVTNRNYSSETVLFPKKDNITILPNTFKNTTKLNHKPLVLSYEVLAQMDAKNKVDFNENEPNIKIHELNSNSHPGMVMPIVITILVVPMFAVVGYMALKRGREAWKNRHYKRMDFLLDGMYNE